MLSSLLGLLLVSAAASPWVGYRGPSLPPHAQLIGRVQGAGLLYVLPAGDKAPADGRRLPGPGPFFTGRVLVKPGPGVDPRDLAAAAGLRYVRDLGPSGWHVLDADAPPAPAVARLRALPGVAGVHADRLLQLETRGPVDNDLFVHQWHLQNTAQRTGLTMTAGADMRAVDAWPVTTGDPAVTIAILDSGVDEDHEDLAGKIVAPFHAGTHEPVATPDRNIPGVAHGTAVAGLAAASGAGTYGAVGVCPDCSIIPVRMLYVENFSADVTVVDAFTHITEQGADVANNSWGYPSGPVPLPVHDAMMAFAKQGRDGLGGVLVWAFGNTYTEISPLNIAADPRVLGVGGTGADDLRVEYSTYGLPLDVMAPTGHNVVDAVAWAPQLVSSDLVGPLGYSAELDFVDPGLDLDDDFTVAMSGTSGAAPVVAGLVGLLLSVEPGLRYEQVFDLLKRTAVKVGDQPYDEEGFNTRYGFGRVDAAAALDALLAGDLCEPTPEVCDDGVDNDCDGSADGLDEDCGFVLPSPAGPISTPCQGGGCGDDLFCLQEPVFEQGTCTWLCFHDGRCPGACASFSDPATQGFDAVDLCLASCTDDGDCPQGARCTIPGWVCVPPCSRDRSCPRGWHCEQQHCVDDNHALPDGGVAGDAGPAPNVDGGARWEVLQSPPPDRVRVRPAGCAAAGPSLWALLLVSLGPWRRRRPTGRGRAAPARRRPGWRGR